MLIYKNIQQTFKAWLHDCGKTITQDRYNARLAVPWTLVAMYNEIWKFVYDWAVLHLKLLIFKWVNNYLMVATQFDLWTT